MSEQGEMLQAILEASIKRFQTEDEKIEAVQILDAIARRIKNTLPKPILESIGEAGERKRRPKQRIDIELAIKVYKTACKYPNYTLRQLDEKLHLYSGTIQRSEKTFLFMGKPLKLSHIVKIARVDPTLFTKRREVKI